MTEGFGRRWKDFFYSLEIHHGLDAEDPSHMWLLHWLFLPAINEDAVAWANTWNSHKIQLEGERRSSPCQLHLRSSLIDGVRGLSGPKASELVDGMVLDEGPEVDEIQGVEVGDYADYGIDWEAMDDPHLMEHHRENNLPEEDDVPSNHPAWINEVICDPPSNPLTEGQLGRLEDELAGIVGCRSDAADFGRLAWVTALSLYTRFRAE